MGVVGNLKAIAAAIAGVAIGALAVVLFSYFITLPAARDDGARVERGVWEKATRDAEAKAEQDRRAAQGRIDLIEKTYHQRTVEQAMQLDALEASILKETDRGQAPSHAGPSLCPAAVPRRLRDALNEVGASNRAQPRP